MSRKTHKLRNGRTLRVLFLVCSMLPLLMGGCPEFRDSLVSVADSLTRGLIFRTDSPDNLIDAATVSVVNAALDLLVRPVPRQLVLPETSSISATVISTVL